MPIVFTPSSSVSGTFFDFFKATWRELGAPDIAWDSGDASVAMVEQFCQSLSGANQTEATMFRAAADWFDGAADHFRDLAGTATEKADATGNRVQANIASVSRELADSYANKGTEALAEASLNSNRAINLATVARWAQWVGLGATLYQILDKAINADNPTDADLESLRETAQGIGGLAGGFWGYTAGVAIAGFVGLTGFPVIVLGTLVAGALGYGLSKVGGVVFDGFLPLVNRLLGDDCFPASVNDPYLRSLTFVRRDPLAIDIDGDGIETVGVSAGVLFDHDADGIKTGTGWLKGDDAFVVLDRNGNGKIDSGRELFGVDTILSDGSSGRDGFTALTDLDANADKLFTSADAQFANVRLWRDLNQDGISQANELQTLAAAGITSIDLVGQVATKNLGNGNIQALTAAVAGVGNESASALDLAHNPFYREFPDHLDTSAVESLPDMAGSGRVRDLKEAASTSTALATLLTDLQTNYHNRTDYTAAIDELILDWANSSDWSTTPIDYKLTARTFYTDEEIAAQPLAETSPGLHRLTRAATPGNPETTMTYAFIYQPAGVTRDQLNGVYGSHLGSGQGTGSSSGSGFTVQPDGTISLPTQTTTSSPPDKWLRVTHLIEVLERFNGLPFVTMDLNAGRVSTGSGSIVNLSTNTVSVQQTGGGSIPVQPIPVLIPISDAQIDASGNRGRTAINETWRTAA